MRLRGVDRRFRATDRPRRLINPRRCPPRSSERFDLDQLDDIDAFEIDDQAAHLFKHAPLGTDGVYEVRQSDPLFSPALPPAHWLMVAEVAGRVLVVPLALPDSGEAIRCRPIGCYEAAIHLADQYRRDR